MTQVLGGGTLGSGAGLTTAGGICGSCCTCSGSQRDPLIMGDAECLLVGLSAVWTPWESCPLKTWARDDDGFAVEPERFLVQFGN